MRMLLVILIFLSIGCQRDTETIEFPIEDYLMALEVALIDQNQNDQEKWIATIAKRIELDSTINRSQKRVLLDQLSHIHEPSSNSDEYESIHYLKQLYLFSSEVSDPYVIALWRFGQDYSVVYKTVKDPKLDLYEWNEFMDQVSCTLESWAFLDNEYNEMTQADFLNDELRSHHQALRLNFEEFYSKINSDPVIEERTLLLAENCFTSYRNLLAYKSNQILLENQYDY